MTTIKLFSDDILRASPLLEASKALGTGVVLGAVSASYVSWWFGNPLRSSTSFIFSKTMQTGF